MNGDPEAKRLHRLVDLLVPSADRGEPETVLGAFWARSASDLAIDENLGMVLPGMAVHVRAAVAGTLESLGDDFADLDGDSAATRWTAAAEDASTRFGALVLKTSVLAMFYTAVDDSGTNPSWPVLSFDGPLLAPPDPENFPKQLATAEVPAEGGGLRADAVVVGSGAGGGVIAARLAAQGLSVLVLERGSYRNEPDLPQLEAVSFPNLYLGGGYLWSTSGSLACLAGSTVGGGTLINSMACMRTPQFVQQEWAARGMEGAADGTLDAHLDAVAERINARSENTRHNAVNRILIRAFETQGLRYSVLARNAKDEDDRYCGSCNAGCLLGCKQSTMKTFLQDASDNGALLVEQCRVNQVLVSEGVTTGVTATVTLADGTTVPLEVEAGTVVLAAGALGTPLLLRASGLGGPAVGEGLHVHPSYFMSGVFEEEVKGWQGQILTAACQEFEQVRDGHGFVIEAAPMSLGFWTGLSAWHDGEQHKAEQLRLSHLAGFWGFTRDHGGGSVQADADGNPVVTWDLDDEIDLDLVRSCHIQLARLLLAAGAREIFTFLPGDPRWRVGDDFEAFVGRLGALAAEDVFTLSAHQSGTCRVGTDPTSSVVDGRGEVHGARCVWVADASALPSSPGVNPMLSIEAFASMVAGHVLDAVR